MRELPNNSFYFGALSTAAGIPLEPSPPGGLRRRTDATSLQTPREYQNVRSTGFAKRAEA